MEISIFTTDLVSSIRNIFLQEMESLPDEVKIARTDGPATEDDVERALCLADSMVRTSANRFLLEERDMFADSTHELPEMYSYIFCGSARRLSGKAQPLADLIGSALKELTLAELFKPLDAKLSESHSKFGEARLEQIDTLLLVKTPPFHRA